MAVVRLGTRTQALPAGAWTIAQDPAPDVRGAGPVGPTGVDAEVAQMRLRARLDDGAPPVTLALAGNPIEAWGVRRWQVDARRPDGARHGRSNAGSNAPPPQWRHGDHAAPPDPTGAPP